MVSSFWYQVTHVGQDSQYLVPGHVCFWTMDPSVVKTQVKKLRGDNAHHIVEAGGCGSRYGRNIRHFPVFHGIKFNFGARIHWS